MCRDPWNRLGNKVTTCAQTSRSLSGGFCPTNLPLFQGAGRMGSMTVSRKVFMVCFLPCGWKQKCGAEGRNGKPPKKFGLAWIHEGKVSGLNTLIEEHGVTPAEIEKVLEALREAYEKHQDAQHYTASIDKRNVVVTASESLEREVHSIIDDILH